MILHFDTMNSPIYQSNVGTKCWTSYMGEGMVVIRNVNDGIEEAIWPVAKLFYQSSIDTRGCHKMRESLYTWVIIWLNTILTPGIKNKIIHKYPYPSAMKNALSS